MINFNHKKEKLKVFFIFSRPDGQVQFLFV